MTVSVFRITLLAAVVSSCIVPSMSMSDGRRLAKHLIGHYDNVGGRLERPALKLMNTGDKLIVECTRDAVWGVGLTPHQAITTKPEWFKGANLGGVLLMELRQKLSKENATTKVPTSTVSKTAINVNSRATILDGGENPNTSNRKSLVAIRRSSNTELPQVAAPSNNSDATLVNFGMAAIRILDFDEESHVITLRAWFRYLWSDMLLQWNPEDFGGVSEVRIDSDLLWKPDLKLYNNYDVDMEIAKDVLAIVYSDGSVLHIPPANLRVQCSSADDTEEICHFKFGSWSYDGNKLDLGFYKGLTSIDSSDFILTNDYEVDFPPARKNVKYYPCCPEPYPDLTFTVTLRHSK